MDVFITIVIIVVLLGILIGLHELGHLIVAKAFNVYCLEYSIGFGPKLFSRRWRNGETAYSLRAIPFGGYVSMYGEGVELPDGMSVPPERALEGISRPRQAMIMGAGIMVNLFLSVLFAFIYSTCFPETSPYGSFSTGIGLNGNLVAPEEGAYGGYYLYADGDIDGAKLPEGALLYAPTGYSHIEEEGGTQIQRPYFLVDAASQIDGRDYVAMYRVESTAYANDFFSNLRFYEADPDFYPTAGELAIGLSAIPASLDSPYEFLGGEEIVLDLTFLTDGEEIDFATRTTKTFEGNFVDGSLVFDATISNASRNRWRSFPEAMSLFAQQYVQFFVMIGTGLSKLFTFDLAGLGSVVMMGSQVNVLTQTIGIGQAFFWYGSALSLNLAIFNLIPIPGLDGWQLLVTTVEGATKKKIPDKVKTIVSYVGLGFLIVLCLILIVKDILSVSGLI